MRILSAKNWIDFWINGSNKDMLYKVNYKTINLGQMYKYNYINGMKLRSKTNHTFWSFIMHHPLYFF